MTKYINEREETDPPHRTPSDLCRLYLLPCASGVGRTGWLPENTAEKGKIKSNFAVEKPVQGPLSQATKFNISSTKPCRQHVLSIGSKENGVLPLQSPFQTPRSNHEKDPRHVPTEGPFMKYLNSVPEKHQGYLKRGSSTKLLQRPETPKETPPLNVMRHLEEDAETVKGH